MKIPISAILILSLWISSCTKEGATSTETIREIIDTTTSKVVGSGSFVGSSNYTVSGKALILTKGNTNSLALENFNSSNGPDLFLYISKLKTPSAIIDLGKLKSTNGNQVYTLAAPVNISEYKFVLIYCKQFNVLFGSAEIK